MRAISLLFVAALAAPAAADPAQKEPQPLELRTPPKPRRDATKPPATDLLSALRDVRAHLKAWSLDPYMVSMNMLLGVDNIAIIRLKLD